MAMAENLENVQRGISSVGRVATARDVPATTACLASAFHDDPLWGRWTFPDETSRPERLYELMRSWTSAAARYPWVWMTERAEAVTVWIPPGKPEMTMEEEARFHTLVGELVGERAGDLNDLFDRFEDHHPQEPHYYLSLWGITATTSDAGSAAPCCETISRASTRSGCPPTWSRPTP
jgi:hypothetical protein